MVGTESDAKPMLMNAAIVHVKTAAPAKMKYPDSSATVRLGMRAPPAKKKSTNVMPIHVSTVEPALISLDHTSVPVLLATTARIVKKISMTVDVILVGMVAIVSTVLMASSVSVYRHIPVKPAN